MPSPADISLLPPASHQNMRENATRCDEARSRSCRPDLFAERHEQVARVRHEGRLDDNDVTPGEQFRRCRSNKHRKAANLFATVKGDPTCVPILTAEVHASRANLGWCGVSQRTKFRSSKLQSSSRSPDKANVVTDASTQQRTKGISRLAAVLDVQSESSRSANQSRPGSCPMTGRRRA